MKEDEPEKKKRCGGMRKFNDAEKEGMFALMFPESSISACIAFAEEMFNKTPALLSVLGAAELSGHSGHESHKGHSGHKATGATRPQGPQGSQRGQA